MKRPKAPRLVTVAITTTITIIFWIFLTLYQVLTTKPTPSVDPQLLEPIDATLDIDSLESIGSRVFFEEGSFVPLITIPQSEELIEPIQPSEPETETDSSEEEVPEEAEEEDEETITEEIAI
jgi:hypothetical protein